VGVGVGMVGAPHALRYRLRQVNGRPLEPGSPSSWFHLHGPLALATDKDESYRVTLPTAFTVQCASVHIGRETPGNVALARESGCCWMNSHRQTNQVGGGIGSVLIARIYRVDQLCWLFCSRMFTMSPLNLPSHAFCTYHTIVFVH
jgi:hypothetical protein